MILFVICQEKVEFMSLFNRNVPFSWNKPGGKMANRLPKGSGWLRGKIMEMVKRGQKTLKAASLELGISCRQAKRIYQRYLEGGAERGA
jgi:hypothetical protein